MPYATQKKSIEKTEFIHLLELAFREDHAENDVTTLSVFRENSPARAHIFVKEEGILSGIPLAVEAFRLRDETLKISALKQDGDELKSGDIVLMIEGAIHSILTAERVALNFLALLSGTSTSASHAKKILAPLDIRVLDTRKTLPAYRALQKYAVAMGGGWNHRLNLEDMGLIKDNHITHAGSVQNAIRMFREKNPSAPLEVEVESIEQLKEALAETVDMILLDNMQPETMKEATKVIRTHNEKHQTSITSEASGGFTLDNIESLRNTGVDFVSMGSLTSKVTPLDFSLEMLS